MKSRLNLEKLVLFIFSFSIFCNSYFMPMWSTYSNKIISFITLIIAYTGTFLLFAFTMICSSNKGKLKINAFIIFILVLILEIHMNVLGARGLYPFTVSEFRFLISIISLFLLSNEQRKKVFEYIIKIFTILVLPSVIYFLLDSLGIHLPYSVLDSQQQVKIMGDTYYQHYPFGLIIYSPWSMSRPCGLFDEPGVVGTLSAILISTNYDKVHKGWSILLFIEGALSFSMAFYVLIIVYATIRAFFCGFAKFSVVLCVLILSFFVFINTEFNSEYISKIQSRIDLTSMFLLKDNRTSNSFDYVFQDFVETGGYPLFMGNGRGAVASNVLMSSSFSYKCLLYDYGLLGSSLYILVFAITACFFGIKQNNIPFLLIFFISIYQRPYVLNLQYFTIFITALSTLQNNIIFYNKGEK